MTKTISNKEKSRLKKDFYLAWISHPDASDQIIADIVNRPDYITVELVRRWRMAPSEQYARMKLERSILPMPDGTGYANYYAFVAQRAAREMFGRIASGDLEKYPFDKLANLMVKCTKLFQEFRKSDEDKKNPETEELKGTLAEIEERIEGQDSQSPKVPVPPTRT